MKFTGPKAKRCRRQGVNLYGSDKYDRVLQRKPQAPGKDPRGRMGRQSEYAQQLKEKQKMRDIYVLSERQFHSIYKRANTAEGQTGDTMKQFLERRLDNVIFRAGFAVTRLQARQFAGHGLFTVNGVRVTCPSYQVRTEDVIAIRERSKSSAVFGPIQDAHEKYLPPSWLKVDPAKLTIEVVALPQPDDAEQAVDVRQVIEFYSRR